ncbi:MAG: hypothetical protein HC902_06165 [Calothrix sp. SM1_5_4]|nr:hypothetical protein [Calothrix sp. SM1_5_4]
MRESVHAHILKWMLDLDELASARAKTLNQQEDAWRNAVWGISFQKLSANMTDGEVETLVKACPSAQHLECLVSYLEARTQATGVAPFTLMAQEAEAVGKSLEDWVSGNPELIDK